MSFLPKTYCIRKVKRENADTFTVDLGKAPPSVPGQFNMLYIPGFGEVAISISDQRKTLTHTIRQVGPATKALAKMKAGAELGVRGPFGKPWPMTQLKKSHAIVVAGGIGLAPVRPVIYALAEKAKERNRKNLETWILYGARSPNDRIFGKDLKTWEKIPGFRVLSTVDKAETQWRGHVGVVTTLFPKKLPEGPVCAISCGPEIMMRFVAMKLEELGMKKKDIYVSTERNMKCAVGFCGHCQLGPHFICKDGPVFRYEQVESLWKVREL